MRQGTFFWLGFALLISSIGHAQEHVINLTQGTNIAVSLSPDKSFLVIDLTGQLWRLPLGGGTAIPLTPPTSIARNPRFSRDGKMIVYQREENLQWDLWIVDLEDGTQHQLTKTEHNETDPDFSVDGDWVVFSSSLIDQSNIWRINIFTKELEQLTNDSGIASFPAVSERDEIVYVKANQKNWSLNLLQEGISTELFSTQHPLRGPSWRPGGGVIVFNEQPSPDQSHLTMLLLDTELVLKPLTQGEDVFGFRSGWISPSEFIYAADGGIWKRQLAGTVRDSIPFVASVPVYNRAHSQHNLTLESSKLSPENSENYAIQVDRLFDGIQKKYRRYVDVHVAGERIIAVVPRGTQPLPDTVIDAKDYTLIPGLIDLHTHPPNISSERAGRAWLAYGVTTVRELVTDWDQWNDSIERRTVWSNKSTPGPRLLITAPVPNDSKTTLTGVVQEANVFQFYRGHPEQFAAKTISLVEKRGLPIFSESLFPSARYGINGIEHLGGLHDSSYSLELSATNKAYQDVFSMLTDSQTFLTPALVAFGGFQRLASNDRPWSRDPAYLLIFSPDERAKWQSSIDTNMSLDNLQTVIADLVKAGGHIGTGSNAPEVPYGLGLHAELALLAEAGLSNDQILRFATAESAAALGLNQDLGTIEPGKLADFVFLSGNPLVRTQDSLTIESIVKNGVWIDRETLLKTP